MLKVLLWFAAVCAGIAVACQSAVNATLSSRISLGAALVVNTSVVLIGTILLLIAGGTPATFFPVEAPWYLYVGGIFGFMFILVNAFIFPRIGAGPAVALAVLGQAIAALAIDHFGLLDIPRHQVSARQIGGFVLIVIGVVLLRR
jgi:transporter family-2 protein